MHKATLFKGITGNEAITTMLRDLKSSAQTVTAEDAKHLVNMYYRVQNSRIRSGNQGYALERGDKPSTHFDFTTMLLRQLEELLKSWLDEFSEHNADAAWARKQIGIGPVLSAGVISYFQIDKAPHPSSFWSYAGYDPTMVWNKGEKPPFNPAAKRLCWNLGQSFVKTSTLPGAKYGEVYRQRKWYEWDKNRKGDYAHLIGKPPYRYGETTEAHKWVSGVYSDANLVDTPVRGIRGEPGVKMLPPAAIQARAERYAVKRFLADLWAVMYENKHGRAPEQKPWIIDHGGHTDYVPPVL